MYQFVQISDTLLMFFLNIELNFERLHVQGFHLVFG